MYASPHKKRRLGIGYPASHSCIALCFLMYRFPLIVQLKNEGEKKAARPLIMTGRLSFLTFYSLVLQRSF
jgi:hypothetical protein